MKLSDINETNGALDELRQIQSTALLLKYKEPQLNDFYKPSEENEGISIFNN